VAKAVAFVLARHLRSIAPTASRMPIRPAGQCGGARGHGLTVARSRPCLGHAAKRPLFPLAQWADLVARPAPKQAQGSRYQHGPFTSSNLGHVIGVDRFVCACVSARGTGAILAVAASRLRGGGQRLAPSLSL